MAFLILFTSILALLSSFPTASHAIDLNNKIVAGSNSSWKSPLGDFEFGFYHLPPYDLYLVGILFAKIPERTLVWYQNPPVEPNSEIQLNSEGHLVVAYPNGTTAFSIHNGDAASSASMQDDGNFVMIDTTPRVVWQSFNSPTNTMLPGQVLNKNGALYSKAKAPQDYSNGDYRLLMQNDGNLVLIAYKWADPSYWYSDTTMFQNVSLVFNTTGSLYLINGTSTIIKNLTQPPTPAEDYYHRATIDEQGRFQQYAYHRTNGSRWTRVWTMVEDPCRVNAICGLNAMCTSPDNETVMCDCIPGFIPLEPNDVTLGCRPETLINYCVQEPPLLNFKLEVLDDTDFQFDALSDYEVVQTDDLEICKKFLMDDCYVLASTFDATTSRCAKKRMPLVNARKSFSSKGIKAMLKVPNSNSTLQSESKTFNFRVFLKVMVGVSSTLACLFGALAFYYHPSAQRLIRRKKFLSASAIGINFREFTFQELQEATGGFSKTIGKGSSGKVYSGNLNRDDAEIAIAVKKLEMRIEKNQKEFMTELKIIGRTHHRNLVRLLGFCIEKNHGFLVYELMPNGTLSTFLFGQRETPHWGQRIEMAHGIARGLLYLHEECETQIIHCDIKPQNVLIDANYTAKISDFGLSKLLRKEQTRTDTNCRGTIGYMAPEWLRSAPVTAKVDVFSFGVMLLEIICCRRHVESSQVDDEENEEDDKVLAKLVLKCIMSKKLEQLVGHDSEVVNDLKRFEQMALVGLWCIHPDAALRPTMKQVNQMLEGTMGIGIPPLLYDEMTADECV